MTFTSTLAQAPSAGNDAALQEALTLTVIGMLVVFLALMLLLLVIALLNRIGPEPAAAPAATTAPAPGKAQDVTDPELIAIFAAAATAALNKSVQVRSAKRVQ